MSDFNKVLIKDDRLMCSPQISYAVMKGAMNNTMVQYSALTGVNSLNPSSLTFNIQVPSEQTVLDRRVIIENTFEVVVAKTILNAVGGSVPSVAEQVWNCDSTVNTISTNALAGADCVNAYPFHQIVNTAQITINNTTVSLNVQDVLPVLIRLNENRNVYELNGSAPIQVDTDGGYGSTIIGLLEGSVAGSPIALNKPSSAFSSSGFNLDGAFSPRASFVVEDTLGTAGTADGVERTTTIRFTTFEPLMVSPFTFANPQSNGQGIYGLQNLSFNFNLGNFNRLIRSRPQIAVSATEGNCLSSTKVNGITLTRSILHLHYLTPQPTDALDARVATQYYELPRYLTPASQAVASVVAYERFPAGVPVNLQFNSVQLNQIPDKLFIYVREASGKYNLNTNCADYFLPIQKININFNNQSGLLSTMTPIELYRMSKDNGSCQTWQEFSGLSNCRIASAYKVGQSGYSYNSIVNGSQVGVVGQTRGVVVPTTGSLLILEFGKDIELPDYYAPGSLGNFNLQFTLECVSYNNINNDTYQIVCIPMNTGCMITEKGQSATYTGLLTKEDVLQASAMEPLSVNDYKRLVGGGFWDSVKSMGSKVWNFAKPIFGDVARYAVQRGATGLQQSGNPLASMAGTAIKSLVPAGSGMSAGAMSAGAMSAGRRKVMKHLSQ